MRRMRFVDLAALAIVSVVAADVVATDLHGPAADDRSAGTNASAPAAVGPAHRVGASPVVTAGVPTFAPGPTTPVASATTADGSSTAQPTAPSPAVPSPATPKPNPAPTTARPSEVTTAASAPPPTPAPTPAPTPVAPAPPLAACPIFPASNVWNRRVDELPVAANSATMVAAIGVDRSLHPDFSNAGGYGIPFNVVGASTSRSTVSFEYDDESDQVGYPIPPDPLIEGGSDRHLLMLETAECRLYELYAVASAGGAWTAGSGATWDLRSNALRPESWTSADAAGLPIFPGLVRHDEVASGEIQHAIRFTAPRTCDGYRYPARHEAGSGSCDVYPPMGLRVRLRADVDLSGFGPQARVVLVALQRYGAILADNGSAWYITGAPSSAWDDDELHDLHAIVGANFEVVDTTGFVNG